MDPSKKPLPPGETGFPLIGETLPFLKNAFGFVDERVARFGPVFRTRLLGADTIVICGPEASEAFIDENLCIRDGAMPAHVQELLAGRNLPMLDGKEHRDRKKQILAGFQRAALESYAPTIQDNVERYLAKWQESKEVSGIEELKRLSLETIARNVTSMPAGPEFEALLADFKLVTAAFTGVPIPLPGTAYTKALAARDRIVESLGEAVAKHRAEKFDDGLSRILRAKADDGAWIADADVIAELHHINVAGYIIFAELAGILTELSRHADIRDRIAREVRESVGSGPLKPMQLGSMPELNQFVKEVKRVVPVVPTIFAKAKKDFELMGFRIPAGWMVFWALRGSNFYKRTFKEPDRFDPDRFSLARAEDESHPQAFTPQGPGPATGHKCPGTDYSTLFMQIFTAVLLRRGSWELPEQNLELAWEKLPPEPKDGLRIRFTIDEAPRGG